MVNYEGTVDPTNFVPVDGSYDYYYSSPIYVFSATNSMRNVFPGEDGVTDGDAGAPYSDSALTTTQTSANWRIELRVLRDADTNKEYI